MSGKVTAQTTPFLVILQYVAFISLILYFGQSLFVPLAFALLISFILFPVCFFFERKGFGRVGSIAAALGIISILLIGLGVLMFTQVTGFLREWPALKDKLAVASQELHRFLTTVIGIPEDHLERWTRQLLDGDFSLGQILQQLFVTSSVSIVLLVLIPVYLALILYHRKLWLETLYRLMPGVSKHRVRGILGLTIKAYYDFIKGVALVYLIVGLLNGLGLWAIGIPHPLLFGFIASVLTFIPYVGIMVGALLPISLAWITYDSIWYPLGVIAVFGVVQYLEANVIFPLAVSRRLHVNTLVVLLAIFAGGILWGLSGMILFVPFVAILKLVADQNPRWKTLSLLLGQEKS